MRANEASRLVIGAALKVPVHSSQVLSYLKLSGLTLGLLLNFNVVHMRDGIRRIINGP